MRDLGTVIDRILEHVPEKETGLKRALGSARESWEYRSPELIGMNWERVARILQDELGNPVAFTEQWECRVFDIFMDKNRTASVV